MFVFPTLGSIVILSLFKCLGLQCFVGLFSVCTCLLLQWLVLYLCLAFMFQHTMPGVSVPMLVHVFSSNAREGGVPIPVPGGCVPIPVPGSCVPIPVPGGCVPIPMSLFQYPGLCWYMSSPPMSGSVSPSTSGPAVPHSVHLATHYTMWPHPPPPPPHTHTHTHSCSVQRCRCPRLEAVVSTPHTWLPTSLRWHARHSPFQHHICPCINCSHITLNRNASSFS